MSLREERPVGWPRQRVGEGPEMKLERVAGANPPALWVFTFPMYL